MTGPAEAGPYDRANPYSLIPNPYFRYSRI